ncbi:glycogen debranching protein GlgX [Thaumasiovibrio sp. DFM-14]|uniref:glycogen debranching protein GlgX n=1 Tax=Thaumasiovibrio sp. DFM-14 TaxID=3384792 RepID=UPI0039A20303
MEKNNEGIYTWVGETSPLGATVKENGVNFCLYSKDATLVCLHLYDRADSDQPTHSFELDPVIHKRGHYWFIFIANITHGQYYAYQVDGTWAPDAGALFNPNQLLIDPYSHAIDIPASYSRSAPRPTTPNHAECMKSIVVDHQHFDWEEDYPPKHPFSDTIIYELHVAGFTRHPTSGVDPQRRGSYLGVIDKIPYLKSLGVTAIELMPIQQFDPDDAPAERKNYWGYSPINFFATHADYASDGHPLTAISELKTLIKALHNADIEVILDVVFNHTAEGGLQGPTFCFKGFGADTYYLLEDNATRFANYSGCGNTCNANQSVVRRMIIEALHYWVKEMHVDGFRFDLASVLSRDSNGHPLAEPPLLWSIDSDPILSGVKIIAEAWDAAGLYQVGSFVGDRWVEWNGRFRDDVRAFWRGDRGCVSAFASRFLGSPDIYHQAHHASHRSINFICAHDGFTLNDLVSYNNKHNLENGEDNRDGDNHNISYNYGIEGPSDDAELEQLRTQQCKNMLATMYLAMGTPMLNMGDEFRRTQAGNNNAYCQDNLISWLDWDLQQKHADLHRFVQGLSQIKRWEPQPEWNTHSSLNTTLAKLNINWHGVEPYQPDWGEHSHSLALTIRHPVTKHELYLIFNAYWEPLTFTLPDHHKKAWCQLIDTAAESPDDIFSIENAPRYHADTVIAQARSVIAMVIKN